MLSWHLQKTILSSEYTGSPFVWFQCNHPKKIRKNPELTKLHRREGERGGGSRGKLKFFMRKPEFFGVCIWDEGAIDRCVITDGKLIDARLQTDGLTGKSFWELGSSISSRKSLWPDISSAHKYSCTYIFMCDLGVKTSNGSARCWTALPLKLTMKTYDR